MEELMRGQGMGYPFDFDDMMQLDGDKLPDKFKCPNSRSLIELETRGFI